MQKLTPALFVQLYMESLAAGHTMRQFADRIGMPTRLAYTRACYYRKRGVRLPKLASGQHARGRRDRLDVAALNAIVADGACDALAMDSQAPHSARRNGRVPVVIAR